MRKQQCLRVKQPPLTTPSVEEGPTVLAWADTGADRTDYL